MMMTYMKSVKQTFINWYTENKVLASILVGAIGFPIALALVGAVIALVITILSFFFGQLGGVAVFLMMLVGAFGGYVWSHGK